MENIRIEDIEIGGEGQNHNYIEMTSEFNKYSKTADQDFKFKDISGDIIDTSTATVGDTAASVHRMPFKYPVLGIGPDATDKENTLLGQSVMPAVAVITFVKNHHTTLRQSKQARLRHVRYLALGNAAKGRYQTVMVQPQV